MHTPHTQSSSGLRLNYELLTIFYFYFFSNPVLQRSLLISRIISSTHLSCVQSHTCILNWSARGLCFHSSHLHPLPSVQDPPSTCKDSIVISIQFHHIVFIAFIISFHLWTHYYNKQCIMEEMHCTGINSETKYTFYMEKTWLTKDKLQFLVQKKRAKVQFRISMQ